MAHLWDLEERHLDFARRYLDPKSDTYGRWRPSSDAAGFERVVRQDSAKIKLALEHVADELDVPLAHPKAGGAPPLDPDMARLAEMGDSADWEEMAVLAKRVMRKVLANQVELSTAQVNVIKEIIGRAEGKIGQAKDAVDDGLGPQVVKVVILPVIDYGMGPVVDLGEVGDMDPGEIIPGLTIRDAAVRPGEKKKDWNRRNG